jgi:hypothetical protein
VEVAVACPKVRGDRYEGEVSSGDFVFRLVGRDALAHSRSALCGEIDNPALLNALAGPRETQEDMEHDVHGDEALEAARLPIDEA